MRALRGARTLDLEARLEALDEAVALADGRLGAAEVDAAAAVLERAQTRLKLGLDLTVVALAGATGSGKSSLFNRLAGSTLSPVGVLRPTTGIVHACVWGEPDATQLLDWLGAPRRHFAEGDGKLDGLVLLDLPDHDSTHAAHRLEVDRLVRLVDLLVWVVDPQKYADAALHERYLRPLRAHAAVLHVVLNRIDELDADARAACHADLRRLLDADGLVGVPIEPTSARTGEGIDELRSVLAERVAARRAALERLSADTATVAAGLAESCARVADARRSQHGDRTQVVDALADAAGVDLVADAVARTHAHRAALATGWPPTRWLRRLRPDPLRRYHLDPGAGDGVSSLPPPTPVQRARIATAVRNVSHAASAHLPAPWPEVVRATASRGEAALPKELDRAVTGTDLATSARPRWWGAARALQSALGAAAAVGALWLAGLFVIAWLRLPDPPTPEIERVPVPTVLLLGGALAGVLLAALCRWAARVGAARRRAAARRRLLDSVGEVAEAKILRPVQEELAAHDRLCEALQRAAGGRSRGR